MTVVAVQPAPQPAPSRGGGKSRDGGDFAAHLEAAGATQTSDESAATDEVKDTPAGVESTADGGGHDPDARMVETSVVAVMGGAATAAAGAAVEDEGASLTDSGEGGVDESDGGATTARERLALSADERPAARADGAAPSAATAGRTPSGSAEVRVALAPSVANDFSAAAAPATAGVAGASALGGTAVSAPVADADVVTATAQASGKSVPATPAEAPQPAAAAHDVPIAVPVAPPAASSQAASAAPAVTATPAPATPPAVPLSTQMSGHFARLTELPEGQHVMTVSVDPEAYGPVKVVAHITPEGTSVHLVSATEAGRDALRAALPDLRRDLAGTGLNAQLDLGDSGAGRGDTPRRDTAARTSPAAVPHAARDSSVSDGPIPTAVGHTRVDVIL